MPETFLIYGSTGTVGAQIAQLAVQRGSRPILAGRNRETITAQAAQLGLEHRIFDVSDAAAVDSALKDVPVVLNCAGPFVYTFKPIVKGCLRTGTHYLDITGEFAVYEGLAALDQEAKARAVMLMPSVGFDIVPTDCLAAHLKRCLPSAERLTLAFYSEGPGRLPPGTMNTMLEHSWQGNNLIRQDGQLRRGPSPRKERAIDFGGGPVQATLLTWGDVFTAFYSTGIPNIEVYVAMAPRNRRLTLNVDRLRWLLRSALIRDGLKGLMRGFAGSTPEQQAQTRTHVWGEVEDSHGRKARARLHGPEPGVVWTALTALAAVQKVLAGVAVAGFQTPSLVFGADFVLECEGVIREDLV